MDSGIIDLLISNHIIAKTLRSHVVFKIFPMLNPDGVFLGNFSEDSDNESGMGNVTRLVMRPPGHSGKAKRGHLCFDASFETGKFERHTILPKLLANNAEDYEKKNTIFNRVLDKLGTARRVFSDTLKDTVNCYSLIVSFYGYIHPVTKELITYKEESCILYSQKRRIEVVTITDKKRNENHKGKLRVVVILSRVHPGESPTSFICQGIIDLLISNHIIAKTLRSHVVFKIFPMLNPDGVFLGNFRFERHTILPKLLANNAEDYEKKNTIFNRVLDKLGTARRVFSDTLKDTVNCYSLIVSFYGYIHPVTKELITYKEESYERIGRVLMKTFLEYYTITGVIPSTPDQITKELLKKKKQSQKMKAMRANREFAKVEKTDRSQFCQPLSKTVLGSFDNEKTGVKLNNKPKFVSNKMRKPFRRRKKSKRLEPEQLQQADNLATEDGGASNRKLNIIDINNITLISPVK
ncbi:cytosolic carboxypeptidase 6-like [Diaphorina citri]|uniref:Cytosolic carboxypeptidase 6-like n=1 Tax=Diaphorina citri TaxID=121845 RepID=A0A3Q0IX78_DIACI|nr:cytosolic carboxypeptidase 6-like [Diaphorina citri]